MNQTKKKLTIMWPIVTVIMLVLFSIPSPIYAIDAGADEVETEAVVTVREIDPDETDGDDEVTDDDEQLEDDEMVLDEDGEPESGKTSVGKASYGIMSVNGETAGSQVNSKIIVTYMKIYTLLYPDKPLYEYHGSGEYTTNKDVELQSGNTLYFRLDWEAFGKDRNSPNFKPGDWFTIPIMTAVNADWSLGLKEINLEATTKSGATLIIGTGEFYIENNTLMFKGTFNQAVRTLVVQGGWLVGERSLQIDTEITEVEFWFQGMKEEETEVYKVNSNMDGATGAKEIEKYVYLVKTNKDSELANGILENYKGPADFNFEYGKYEQYLKETFLSVKGLAGAVFEVYYPNEKFALNFIQYQNQSGVYERCDPGTAGSSTSVQVDANGHLKLIFYENEFGQELELREVQAPDGYTGGQTIRFKVAEVEDSTEMPIFINMINDSTEVIVNKVDEKGNKLSDAVFELYQVTTAGNRKITSLHLDNGFYWWFDADNNDTGKTESVLKTIDGQLIIRGLPFGSYYLKETAAPDGYEFDSSELYNFLLDGTNNPGEITVVNKETDTGTTKITLTKVDVDSGASLTGAVFELHEETVGRIESIELVDGQYWYYDTEDDENQDKEPAQLVTNSAGQIVVNDLPEGTYYFVEITPPTGYEMIAEQSAPLMLNGSNRIRSVIMRNRKKPDDKTIDITLKKVDADDHTIPLEGAKFLLYRGTVADANRVTELTQETGTTGEYKYDKDARYTDPLVTDSNGQIVVKNLPDDTYIFVEVEAPGGYKLDATPRNLTDSNSITVFNEKTGNDYTSITLIKKEEGSNNTVLEGAVFELYREGVGKVTALTGGNGAYVYSAGASGDGLLTTSSNGEIIVTKLPAGKYYFKEVTAPAGYEIIGNGETGIFELVNGSTTGPITVDNRKKTPSTKVTLTKRDTDTASIRLQGAEFELYQRRTGASDLKIESFTGSNGVYWYDEDAVQSSWAILTTDSNGQLVINGLDPGRYYFRETKAPAGYELDQNKTWQFTLSNNSTATATVDAENTLIPPTTTVTLNKRASHNTSLQLQGAVFNLYRRNPNGTSTPMVNFVGSNGVYRYVEGTPASQRATLTTNSNGQIIIYNLPAGYQYYFVETRAPSGYILNSRQHNVDLRTSNTATVQVLNDRNTSSSSSSSSSSSRPYTSSSRSSSSRRDYYYSSSSRGRLPLDTDIPDNSVPLANTPSASIPGTTIEDNNVPLTNLPQTGLSGPRISAIFLFMAASAGTIALLSRDNKRKKK